jgi:hypothetical protein
MLSGRFSCHQKGFSVLKGFVGTVGIVGLFAALHARFALRAHSHFGQPTTNNPMFIALRAQT